MSSYAPLPAAHDQAGHVVRWTTWDGDHLDTTTVRWENEGFTVTGVLTRERVEYVLRLSATWQVRQFILFRDLEEPDLWLATDGTGRWGEMNGAHRTELDGCYDVELACTPFTATVPIRRLPLLVGNTAEVPVIRIDTETLQADVVVRRYTRIGTHRWRVERDDASAVEFDVDDFGIAIDYPEEFRRSS